MDKAIRNAPDLSASAREGSAAAVVERARPIPRNSFGRVARRMFGQKKLMELLLAYLERLPPCCM
jgi:hypothetical protein